jgi:hypothetical protein
MIASRNNAALLRIAGLVRQVYRAEDQCFLTVQA